MGPGVAPDAAEASIEGKKAAATPDAERAGASAPKPSGRFVVPLKPAMVVVFVLMTVPVLLAIIRINYVSTDHVARAHAAVLVERFLTAAVQDVETDFAALRSLIGTAAELGAQAPAVFEDERALRYLFRVLQHSETVLNVYVGLEDGSFRQARRIHDPDVPIHGQRPPEGAVFAYRLVEPALGPLVLDRYVFLDTEQSRMGEAAAASGYDPRQRVWYGSAAAAGTTMITDPEVFWAFGLVGFTVAAPFHGDGKLLGVVAADITLDSFSAYLAQHPISPGSLSYLLDHQGRVLAASDGSATYASEDDAVELPHVTALGSELTAMAYGAQARNQTDAVELLTADDDDYIVGLAAFDEAFGKRWQLLVITPLDDFTEPFTRNNRHMLLAGLAAIVVQLAIIYLLASLIASPLQKLALKVDRIHELEHAGLPPVASSLREVAVLSRAIETLDAAVKAFACFVPVGLVRQLLQSEQKLELGGQSRFLTILFSDVEGFSAMAEQLASRELLGRMSTLLEVVSQGVHDEHGTIDKFVGDGVMAFWGAPARLDDHAWHACVAALRIQRALDELNEQWRGTGAREMRVRIGIHSDAVLVGNIGSPQRMSYTVIGDGVNIAARLEDINKIYGTLTCLSHDTFREAGDRLCVRPIDEVAIKGRRSRVTIYELLGAYGTNAELKPSAEVERLATLTRRAFEAIVSGDRGAALAGYQEVLAAAPGDPVADVHVQRLTATSGSTPIGGAREPG
ncbi:MAG: adenylate/guanylate cyclase domain-containing protein [Pseudomonadota bacterium]